jgi:hypothetical protein
MSELSPPPLGIGGDYPTKRAGLRTHIELSSEKRGLVMGHQMTTLYMELSNKPLVKSGRGWRLGGPFLEVDFPKVIERRHIHFDSGRPPGSWAIDREVLHSTSLHAHPYGLFQVDLSKNRFHL